MCSLASCPRLARRCPSIIWCGHRSGRARQLACSYGTEYGMGNVCLCRKLDYSLCRRQVHKRQLNVDFEKRKCVLLLCCCCCCCLLFIYYLHECLFSLLSSVCVCVSTICTSSANDYITIWLAYEFTFVLRWCCRSVRPIAVD